MRVLVIGAGVIGSIYGWALTQSRHEVVHLVRPGRAAALRRGLMLDVFDRRSGREASFRGLYMLTAEETLSLAEPFDFVIVPVKHYALIQTLMDAVPRSGAADFLMLTQNWNGVAEIDAILPRARYIYGDAKAGGAFSGETLIATVSGLDIGPPKDHPMKLLTKPRTSLRPPISRLMCIRICCIICGCNMQSLGDLGQRWSEPEAWMHF